MKLKIILLTTVLAVAAAVPVEVTSQSDVAVRNSVLEELFLGIIEGFRQQMITGSDSFPVLDPLEITHLHLELDNLGIPGHITLGDLEARHLSTFVIDDFSISTASLLLQRYTIVVDGHIPVIEIDSADYDLNINALGVNVFGKGSAKLRIIEPRIQAEIEAGLSLIGLTITLRDARVSFFLKGFETQISGLFGNEMVDDFINAFISDLVPELVQFLEDDITEILSSLVLEIGNDLLDNINILGRYGQDLTVAAMLPALEAGLEVGPTQDAA